MLVIKTDNTSEQKHIFVNTATREKTRNELINGIIFKLNSSDLKIVSKYTNKKKNDDNLFMIFKRFHILGQGDNEQVITCGDHGIAVYSCTGENIY